MINVVDIECLHEDTLVTTSTGNIKKISEISDTEKIIGSAEERKVINKLDVLKVFNKGIKKCKEIKSKYSLPIIASEKHLFFTQNGWKYCKDITCDDFFLVPKKINDFQESKFTDKELSLVGWFVSEGCRTEGNKGTVTISCAEQEYINLIKNTIVFEGCNWKNYPTNNTIRLSLNKTGRLLGGDYRTNPAKSLLIDLELLDKYSYEKKIPSQILQSSNRQLAIVLGSLFMGDGTVAKNKLGVTYNTTSKMLAHQIHLVLSRFGILSSVSSVEDNRKDSYKDCWFIQILGEARYE